MIIHYHLILTLFVLSFFIVGGLATSFIPSWGDVRVKHSWDLAPNDWTNLGHPAADTTIDLHIALKAQDENALIEALYEVSSPNHTKYGKHLSREQVAELVAPPPDVLELVHAWLAHHGVIPSTVLTKHSGSRVSLIGVPVSKANDLLRASYQLYQHSGTNTTVLRTLSYGLPEALLEHVQTVEPTTYFGVPRKSQKPRMPVRRGGAAEATPAKDSELGPTALLKRVQPEYITPDILRWLYRSASYVPTAANWNVIGIAGLNDEYPSPSDLMQFMKEFRTDGTYATYTVITINGGAYNPSNPAFEPNLDIQFSFGIAYPIRLIFYSIGHTPRDPFAAWLEYMLDQTNVPQTISASYGVPEHLASWDHVSYVCNLFAQLGARGASVLAGSGDDGVGKGDCVFNDGQGNSHVRFSPTFPSTCPWVTSVGATTGINPEEAAKFSGGGFSAYFPRPLYQNPAVPIFLQNLGGQYSGLYNPSGRGVPDIALQAFSYKFVLNKKFMYLQGTSCSSPAAAAFIAMLNDYMITTGRKTLGFLNPWLYGAGLAGLNDIRIGSNPGCNTPGFSATPGWDPVTGLGTLNFAMLGELLSYGF